MATGQQLPWSWKPSRTNKRDVPWTDKPKYRSFIQLLIKCLRDGAANRHCADCGVRHRWATPLNSNNPDSQHVAYANPMLGVIICTECAKCHNQFLPRELSIVLYTYYDLDRWTFDDIAQLTLWGNERAQSYWLANYKPGSEYRAAVIRPDPSVMTRREWIIRKYAKREWALDTLPTTREPYTPSEMKVFSTLRKISWIHPPDLNQFYLPARFFNKTPSPRSRPFESPQFSVIHDVTNASERSFDPSSQKVATPSVVTGGDDSPANTLPRISIDIQRRKRKPSVANTIASWRQDWMASITKEATRTPTPTPTVTREEEPRDRAREVNQSIYSDYYDYTDYDGTVQSFFINKEDSVRAWQTSALGNPEVTKFMEENWEFQDPTFAKPTGLIGPLLSDKQGQDMDFDSQFLDSVYSPQSAGILSTQSEIDKARAELVLEKVFVQKNAEILKVQSDIEKARASLGLKDDPLNSPTEQPVKPKYQQVQDILKSARAELNAGHISPVPKENLVDVVTTVPENQTSSQQSDRLLNNLRQSLNEPDTQGPVFDQPTPTLAGKQFSYNPRSPTDNPPSDTNTPPQQQRRGVCKTNSSSDLEGNKLSQIDKARKKINVRLPSSKTTPDQRPQTPVTKDKSQITSRKRLEAEPPSTTEDQTIAKAIDLLLKLDDDGSTKDVGTSERSNMSNETVIVEDDSSLLADLNSAFLEAGFGSVSVDYRCVSDEETDVDSELDKIEFEFGEEEMYPTQDEVDMTVDEMRKIDEGTGKEKMMEEMEEEMFSLDWEDLHGKIVPPDTDTPKKESLSKETPKEEECPKMTFGSYLARYVNDAKGDQHNVSSRERELVDFEKEMDRPKEQNMSEQDGTEIEIIQTTPLDDEVRYKNDDDDEHAPNLPLPLIPLEKTVPIASHETGVISTPQSNLPDTDVPNADEPSTQPNSYPESSSLFAKLAMFNLQNLQSSTKRVPKVGDTGTQGELLNFLLKSGLF